MITPPHQDPAILRRFWDRVDTSGTHCYSIGTKCWEWLGAKTTSGHGCFTIRKKIKPAHRFSWEIKYGPIPQSRYVKQRCMNPLCVNPGHLYIKGAREESLEKALSRGRISDEEKADVYEKVTVWGMTQKEVASEYQISQSYVSGIVKHLSTLSNKDLLALKK